jgi:hypothetical protein
VMDPLQGVVPVPCTVLSGGKSLGIAFHWHSVHRI